MAGTCPSCGSKTGTFTTKLLKCKACGTLQCTRCAPSGFTPKCKACGKSLSGCSVN